jgi:hypothetical protein
VRGTEVFQAKGFPYRLEDLFGDPALVERYRDGVFVTLRLKLELLPPLPRPLRLSRASASSTSRATPGTSIRSRCGGSSGCSARTSAPCSISSCRRQGNRWRSRRGGGDPGREHPRARPRPNLLDLRYRGPNEIACARVHEAARRLGWFEHGSTIVVFASPGFDARRARRRRGRARAHGAQPLLQLRVANGGRSCRSHPSPEPPITMTTNPPRRVPQVLLRDLMTQRWDDHRFYHHSRINQTLHLISALSFLVAYVICGPRSRRRGVPRLGRGDGDAPIRALLLRAARLRRRQPGTFEHKEEIKVGYNLRAQGRADAAWALDADAVWASPTLFGIYSPTKAVRLLRPPRACCGSRSAIAVLAAHATCVITRSAARPRGMTKILTDPFHDVRIYWQARRTTCCAGALLDPMTDWPEPLRRA